MGEEALDLALYLLAVVAVAMASGIVWSVANHVGAWLWDRLTPDSQGDAVDDLNERTAEAFAKVQRHLEKLDERVSEMEGGEDE